MGADGEPTATPRFINIQKETSTKGEGGRGPNIHLKTDVMFMATKLMRCLWHANCES